MEKFYCLKLINTRTGLRGYVMEDGDGIKIVTNGLIASIKQFDTYQDAQQYMREKKLERAGANVYIRDNNDVMKDFAGQEGLKPAEAGMVYLEHPITGAKLCHDLKEGYFYRECTVGYCFWKTEKDAQDFIDAISEGVKPIIKPINI